MAAGAWKVFNRAKKFIGNGTLSLSSTTFRMALATSASNLKTSGSGKPLINRTSLTGQVTSTLGCPVLGKALTGELWTTGASAKQIKFDTDDLIFTATTSAIANIKYAVIFLTGASAGAQKLLCYSTLTTSQITSLAIGNTLTVQMASGGVLTLT
jgi:hypothetical protein